MHTTGGRTFADNYKNLQDPVLKVFIGGRELLLCDEAYLGSAWVVSSSKKEPDMAVVTYLVNRAFPESIRNFEGFLALGQKTEVQAGYGSQVSRIFLGYLHEISVSDKGEGYLEYTLLCLDVKGLMKKNNGFAVSGVKTAQQVMDEILGAEIYAPLIEKKTVTPIPASLNTDCVIGGETDYDWLCGLAERLDYEFFCGRGELVFCRAGEAYGETVELSAECGLREVKLIVSMGGQTGSIRVGAYNQADEKLSVNEPWHGVSGPFVQNLKQRLKGFSLSFWEMGIETGEQAGQAAKKRMARTARQCLRMEVRSLGMPKLMPGICVKIADDASVSLCGGICAEEVEHRISGKGYETVVRGTRC